MELYQLRTFVIVAEEENVTKAAKRLFTTPPSVSAHIKALEEEWNVQLFVRTPKGMQITEQGVLLKQKAEQTLRAAQDLANHATKIQDQLMGQLNFGLNATPNFLRVAEIVKVLHTDCPGLDLHVVNSHTAQILDDLKDSQLDTGYIFGPPPDESITVHRVHTAELVITAPRNWAAHLEKATWAEVADLPWITSPHYCPFQTITDELFAKHNLTPQQRLKSADEATKSELVCSGVGLALLERSEAEQVVATGQAFIWETDPIYCDLHLAYLTRRKQDLLIEAFVEIIQKVWV